LKRASPSASGDGQVPDVAKVSGVPRLTDGRRPGVLRVIDHQVLRFAMVGIVNSVFGLGVFAGLQLTMGRHVHYLVILLISHVVSVLEAYVLQRRLVFQVSGRWWRDLARFWSVYLVALAINLVALPLLVEIAHLSVLPAQTIVMLGVALGSFVAHRSFSFRRPGGTIATKHSPNNRFSLRR
jgi:putative flippase GtrA